MPHKIKYIHVVRIVLGDATFYPQRVQNEKKCDFGTWVAGADSLLMSGDRADVAALSRDQLVALVGDLRARVTADVYERAVVKCAADEAGGARGGAGQRWQPTPGNGRGKMRPQKMGQ